MWSVLILIKSSHGYGTFISYDFSCQWKFFIFMDLFHASVTFSRLNIFSVQIKLLSAYKTFLYRWKFIRLVLLFHAQTNFTYVFINVKLFCIVRSFAGLPNLSIFMKFVHADESFPCSWNFFIFAKCFHGYGTFICFPCPFIYFHAHLIFSCLWNIPFS